MRFDDLIKKPAKPQKPLTYTESLQAKLDAEMSAKPAPKFTAVEWAIMEGGGSLEEAPIEERKRKRKKVKHAAYGPGPYGWYGYDAGYSGDGGVEEAEASDVELKQRWGDFDPEDKPMLPTTQLNRAPAPTLWTAYDAIRDILGSARVTDDDDELEPGMYYVYQSSQPPMFRDTEDSGPGGSINVPNLESKAARDVAIAVHEAYHAYVHDKTKGQGAVHSNEKIINNLAEKWLRAHLSGPALHVALETITGSRISYGKDHIPARRATDMRENSTGHTSYGETFGQASQEKTNIMRKHNIKPGDAEWFKLWFGLPYMTGEKPYESK